MLNFRMSSARQTLKRLRRTGAVAGTAVAAAWLLSGCSSFPTVNLWDFDLGWGGDEKAEASTEVPASADSAASQTKTVAAASSSEAVKTRPAERPAVDLPDSVRLPTFMPPWGALTPRGTYASELTVTFTEEALRRGAPDHVPTLLLYTDVEDGSLQLSAQALGLNVWTLRVDDNVIFEERGEHLPESVEASRVLRDWTLANWPAISLKSRLTRGWTLSETLGQDARTSLEAGIETGLANLLNAQDLRAVELRFEGTSLYRLWTGTVAPGETVTFIANDREGYRLTIDSKKQ